jgi:5-methylcytosine-specific restriction protein B
MGINSSSKKNFKEDYNIWLKIKTPKDSGSKSSYIRAIELLSETIGYPIFEENDVDKMHALYEDLILEQRIEGGKYWNKKSTSYGLKGFYSAAIKTYSEFLKDYLLNNISANNKIMDTTNFKAPLNQILYGPPGTGKTYNTILEAAKIITGNEFISYEESLVKFNEKLGIQIEFITFHQNYSYEDFIQGIRPDTENGKELTFEKKDGIFKRIADRALKNLTDSEKPESAKKDFDAVFHNFVLPLIEEDEIEVKMKKTSFYITQISEKSIEFRKNQGDSQHTLSINTLRKMYNDGLNEIILGGLQPYYNPILRVLLEKGKSQFTPVEKKNFVIIIDEINRANISRVFGELITLIEKDKRSHGKIPMRVTLPSGDSFIVPSNLYIIGTMNTADKSIALLDIALRRRFDFVAKYPDVSLVRPEYEVIFLAINKAILDRKNHDFTIGHAYFMDDDYTLESTINNKVIPLLLEYFMNDEKEVTAILLAAKITIGSWPLKMLS